MATTAIAISLLSLSSRLTSAAPLTPLESQLQAANGNKTLLNSKIAPSWATTSNARSTASLLWTCVLTLSICVYTVIHVNVPPPDETRYGYYMRKTKWVATAILLPELVLAMALQQWSYARALKRELNSIYSTHSDGKAADNLKEFSMTYCFYAVMGGFMVDVSDIHDDCSLLTLQPSGIVNLAKNGHFIEISEKSIKDKSKADVLAKLLVCVQVVWMIIQCIGRKAEALPISLLEIHTLVHIACALCMYALWIEKPLDILDPTIVDASKFPNEVALMLVGSQCSGDHTFYLRLYDPYNGSLDSVPKTAYNDEDVEANGAEQNSLSDRNAPASIHIITYATPEDTIGRLEHRQWVDSGERRVFVLDKGQSLPCGLGLKHDDVSPVELSERDVNRWVRATVALRQDSEVCPASNENLMLPSDDLQKRSRNFQDRPFNVRDIQSMILSGLGNDPLFWAMLVVLPMVYGSIHLTAWNFEFPTNTEKIMWRLACTLIAGGTFGLLVLLIIFHIGLAILDGKPVFGNGWVGSSCFGDDCFGDGCFGDCYFGDGSFGNDCCACGYDDCSRDCECGWREWREWFVFIIITGSIIIFGTGLIVLYFGARLFIIVESFISIRKLPLGVYLTVDWANYIPHL